MELSEQILFDEWITRIFDHQVDNIDRSLADRHMWGPSASPPIPLEYMVRLFENAASVLAPFTDNQQRWGLDYIVNNSPSQETYLLLGQPELQRCIRAILTIFEQFFAVNCWSNPFDLENKKYIDQNCGFWWLEFPVVGKPDDPEYEAIDNAFLEVMRQILALNSDACRHSALLGLGNWAAKYPLRVEQIIDEFLARTFTIRPELIIVASRARVGFKLTTQQRDKMIAEIERAFAGTQYPHDDIVALRNDGGDYKEIADAFDGKLWQSLYDVQFLRHHSDALSFFNPESFQYYLPAFMRASLLDRETADVIPQGIIFHLTPPEETPYKLGVDRFLSRVTGFSAEQATVVKAFFEQEARLDLFTYFAHNPYFEETEAERKRAFAFWENYKG